MAHAPRYLTAFIVFVSVASRAASAQTTSYPYQRPWNPAGVKTFAFKETTQDRAPLQGKAASYDSPIVAARTEDAIAWELARRGLKRDDENPDVYVVVRRSYQSEYMVYNSGWWTPYPWGGWWYGPYDSGWIAWNGWGPTYVYENVVGTLIIDVEDAASGRVVWRGVGTKDVHVHSRESSRDKHVREEVRKALKRFPLATGTVS